MDYHKKFCEHQKKLLHKQCAYEATSYDRYLGKGVF